MEAGPITTKALLTAIYPRRGFLLTTAFAIFTLSIAKLYPVYTEEYKLITHGVMPMSDDVFHNIVPPVKAR